LGLVGVDEQTYILIMAGGDNWRFKALWPKEISLIKGYPLIARTIRQVQARGYQNIEVVTHKPEVIASAGKKVAIYNNYKPYLISAVANLFRQHASRTIVLLGDVIWTDTALETVLACWDEVRFWGLIGEKKKHEIFALTFTDFSRVKAFFEKAILYNNTHNLGKLAGKLWLAYRAGLNVKRLEEHYIGPLFTQITDGTTDIDSLAEYEAVKDLEIWEKVE
jgi:hypothetical protein